MGILAVCTCAELLGRMTHTEPVEWDVHNMIKHLPRSVYLPGPPVICNMKSIILSREYYDATIPTRVIYLSIHT